jgi:Mlc titration factor MtfA (ptsG expression regulator)
MFKWLRRLRALPPIPEAAWQATLARYAFLADRPARPVERLRTDGRVPARQGIPRHPGLRHHRRGGAGHRRAGRAARAAPEGRLDWYDDFVGIVVHPSEVVARRKVVDEAQVVHEYDEVVAGEAMDRGPVMLSWQDVLASSVTSEAATTS